MLQRFSGKIRTTFLDSTRDFGARVTTSGEDKPSFEPSWAPIPGPVNRESFFEAQRRNRQATWRLSAVCILAVIFTGIPLSLILAPPVYGLLLLGLAVAKRYVAVPPEIWQTLVQMGSSVGAILDHFSNNKPLPPLDIVLTAAAVVLLPGIVIQFLLWLGMRALFLRAGAGGVLLTLGARVPNTEDLKEKRLVDVVAEMAIAGGLPPLKVMLLDSEAGNAAVVGGSRQDATLVVSRRVLEELERDELQAVVAHLIGSAGNGDLHIAMTMVSVYQAFGLLNTLINAPFGPRARRALWALMRIGFRRGGTAEVDQVSEMLTQGLQASDDLESRMDKSQEKAGCLSNAFSVVMLPAFFFNFSLKFTMWVFSFLLFEPTLAWMWRTRRYLADASAVQLTRNPDGLALALQRLGEIGGYIPGGKWASHLFIVDEHHGMPRELARRMQALRAEHAGQQLTREQMMALAREALMLRGGSQLETQPVRDDTLEKTTGGAVSFHPPIEKRLKRLQALGAHFAAGGSAHKTPRQRAVLALVLLLFSPLLFLVVGMMLTVVVMLIGLNFVFTAVAFAIILALVRLIP